MMNAVIDLFNNRFMAAGSMSGNIIVDKINILYSILISENDYPNCVHIFN